jgi:hypothetical protein
LSCDAELTTKGLALAQQDRTFVLKFDHSLATLDAVGASRPHAETSARVEAKEDKKPN